jgi:rsbT co-antagonist protein RsbR
MNPPLSGGEAPSVDELLAENAALRERNELLTALLANSPVVVFVKDLEGRYIFVNKRFADLFQLSADSVIGKTDFDLAPREVAEQMRANDLLVIEGQEGLEIEEVVPAPDGVHIYLSFKFNLRNLQGEVYGTGGIATDITERKRDEEHRALLQQQIIDSQRLTLRELSTPIIPLADGVIAMPLIGAIDKERAQEVMQALLAGAASFRCHTALVDITGVKTVDAHVASALLQAAHAARLLGVEVILTGIRAEVAQALVHLGADLSGLVTLGTLQSGIAMALSRGGGGGSSRVRR